ncbi:hypothetical protein B0H13DRAFT_1914741 [Mycena leptocephala]|nr:hypothetical protein B0H13DRAFT_1914741 [Mycena leptocephala]
MDQMGIWDAVELGRQLDGELGASPDLAREDNTLLAEVLAALDVSDPFDACNTQADAQKLAKWYPYSLKTILLLDICDNLPRLLVSESLMQTFIWILKQCGARDECANPAIRSQFHLYPETEEGVHYYLDELSQLTDGRFVIPVRWIKVDRFMHVNVYLVELDQENKACVKKDMLRVSTTLLKFNFLDLTFKNEIPDWSRAAMDSGFRDHIPNSLCAVTKGDPFYTILVDYFSNDVSGNQSNMEQTFT